MIYEVVHILEDGSLEIISCNNCPYHHCCNAVESKRIIDKCKIILDNWNEVKD